MAEKTKGTCGYCGKEMTRGGMSRHLASCARRKEVVAAADAGKGREQALLHLLVQDARPGAYWLHLEMRGGATLDELDEYLRSIWLECCDHLSAFSAGRWGDEMDMSLKAEKVFAPGVVLHHAYDFGSTTHSLVTWVSVRRGKPTTRQPIVLMARNAPFELACNECQAPATYICMECAYDGNAGLCDAHAEDHPHEDWGGPRPLVNSPRVGVCAYDGPAEPPY